MAVCVLPVDLGLTASKWILLLLALSLLSCMETLVTLQTTCFTQYRVIEAIECTVDRGDDDWVPVEDTAVVIQDWRYVQGYRGLEVKLKM